MLGWFSRTQTLAARVAAEDRRAAAKCNGRRFAAGHRPVMRWIKGDGLDDDVTRAAIAQATRLFGPAVDYCLCTQGIDAARARAVLAWAAQPVEWWPVTADDNPALAGLLQAAGCPPERFGYWWKWFPERVRPEGPVFSQPDPDVHDRFEWLGGFGQWGIPGWTMPAENARNVLARAAPFAGREVLELGTSRGRVTAMLATIGCRVTTIDHQDRGAAANLAGLGVNVVIDDAVHFLRTTPQRFDLVVCDVHGNSPSAGRLLFAKAEGRG